MHAYMRPDTISCFTKAGNTLVLFTSPTEIGKSRVTKAQPLQYAAAALCPCSVHLIVHQIMCNAPGRGIYMLACSADPWLKYHHRIITRKAQILQSTCM